MMFSNGSGLFSWGGSGGSGGNFFNDELGLLVRLLERFMFG